VDPSRKRRIRFVVALSAAVLLAGALAYTSFSASSEARTPSQLRSVATPGKTYQLTGKVVAGYRQDGGTTYFKVRDRDGHVSVPVRYTGPLPDPFRADREVVVDVDQPHRNRDRRTGARGGGSWDAPQRRHGDRVRGKR